MDSLPTRLIHYPDPRLRVGSAPIAGLDESISALAQRMLELMHDHRGVGLAAPQVGVNLRVFVCNPTGQPGDDRVYINPELSDLTGSVEAEEGCLSIPEVRVMVRRARRCRLAALDLAGNPVELAAEDLMARIFQHEIDHLDGRLIIDRMNATDKVASKKQLTQLEADFKKAARRASAARR